VSNYQTMKNQELKDLAQERTLPLDYENISRQDLITQLKAYDQQQAELKGEVDEAQDHRKFMKGKVRLLVHPGDNEGGERPVFVSFNGHDFYVPRDVEVVVPFGVFEVLKNARTSKIETDMKGNIKERATLRFPFTVLEMGERY